MAAATPPPPPSPATAPAPPAPQSSRATPPAAAACTCPRCLSAPSPVRTLLRGTGTCVTDAVYREATLRLHVAYQTATSLGDVRALRAHVRCINAATVDTQHQAAVLPVAVAMPRAAITTAHEPGVHSNASAATASLLHLAAGHEARQVDAPVLCYLLSLLPASFDLNACTSGGCESLPKMRAPGRRLGAGSGSPLHAACLKLRWGTDMRSLMSPPGTPADAEARPAAGLVAVAALMARGADPRLRWRTEVDTLAGADAPSTGARPQALADGCAPAVKALLKRVGRGLDCSGIGPGSVSGGTRSGAGAGACAGAATAAAADVLAECRALAPHAMPGCGDAALLEYMRRVDVCRALYCACRGDRGRPVRAKSDTAGDDLVAGRGGGDSDDDSDFALPTAFGPWQAAPTTGDTPARESGVSVHAVEAVAQQLRAMGGDALVAAAVTLPWPSEQNLSALHVACASDTERGAPVVCHLLSLLPPGWDVDGARATPLQLFTLHTACEMGRDPDATAVKALLARGADTEGESLEGMTPRDYASHAVAAAEVKKSLQGLVRVCDVEGGAHAMAALAAIERHDAGLAFAVGDVPEAFLPSMFGDWRAALAVAMWASPRLRGIGDAGGVGDGGGGGGGCASGDTPLARLAAWRSLPRGVVADVLVLLGDCTKAPTDNDRAFAAALGAYCASGGEDTSADARAMRRGRRLYTVE